MAGELISLRRFDHDLNLLILDIAPKFLAPQGYRARSILAAAFKLYFENYVPGQTESSAMVLARYSANLKYGITAQNQGLLEVGTLLGILANTIPAIFYMLVHVYSDQALLQDLRNELKNTSLSTPPNNRKRILRVANLREKCHLLHSTFQEVLRVHAQGAGARFVREDTMLDNRYLLEKGMVVQMPIAVLHSDPLSWGSNAEQFQPRRFLRQKDAEGMFKANSSAYRPFGGGTSLCPGRHFVTLEALALTAYLILNFDIEPRNCAWSIPGQKQESLATNVFPPDKDVEVRIARRRGFEDVTLDLIVG